MADYAKLLQKVKNPPAQTDRGKLIQRIFAELKTDLQQTPLNANTLCELVEAKLEEIGINNPAFSIRRSPQGLDPAKVMAQGFLGHSDFGFNVAIVPGWGDGVTVYYWGS